MLGYVQKYYKKEQALRTYIRVAYQIISRLHSLCSSLDYIAAIKSSVTKSFLNYITHATVVHDTKTIRFVINLLCTLLSPNINFQCSDCSKFFLYLCNITVIIVFLLVLYVLCKPLALCSDNDTVHRSSPNDMHRSSRLTYNVLFSVFF